MNGHKVKKVKKSTKKQLINEIAELKNIAQRKKEE